MDSRFRHLYDLRRLNLTAETKFSREVSVCLMLDLWLNRYAPGDHSRLALLMRHDLPDASGSIPEPGAIRGCARTVVRPAATTFVSHGVPNYPGGRVYPG